MSDFEVTKKIISRFVHIYFSIGVIHHDGDSVPEAVNCPSTMNYIMAPSSAIINSKTVEYSFKFSDCSIYQMKQQVKRLRERWADFIIINISNLY